MKPGGLGEGSASPQVLRTEDRLPTSKVPEDLNR